MKKNIFLLVCLLSPHFLASKTPLHDLEPDEKEENTLNTRCENIDEFEDFFGAGNEESNAAPRQQKPKLSRMQLAMIRLGVSVALRIESFCCCMHSLYQYLKSWVVCEKRKA